MSVIDNPSILTGRERILHTASELFCSNGYAETSLRTIADAVEMRPASIYHHFESKDALLAEILDIGMHAVNTAFADVELAHATQTPSPDPQTRLRDHVAGHLHALFAHESFTAAHVTVFPFTPADTRRAAVPTRDAYEASWTALLHDIAPALDDDAIRITRLSLFGAMNTTIQWFDPAAGSTDDLATAIVHALWNGLDTIGTRR